MARARPASRRAFRPSAWSSRICSAASGPTSPSCFSTRSIISRKSCRTRDDLTRRWGLNLINLRATEPRVGLWQADSTEACCARHKVGPLFAALEEYDVWFTALRRDQSPTRAGLQEVEPFRLPSGKTIQRVSPLAAWTLKDVWAYAKQHDIPLLSLYELGYTSIGCEPCTSLPLDPSNPRSGRWQGQKLECGIHIQAQ